MSFAYRIFRGGSLYTRTFTVTLKSTYISSSKASYKVAECGFRLYLDPRRSISTKLGPGNP